MGGIRGPGGLIQGPGARHVDQRYTRPPPTELCQLRANTQLQQGPKLLQGILDLICNSSPISLQTTLPPTDWAESKWACNRHALYTRSIETDLECVFKL